MARSGSSSSANPKRRQQSQVNKPTTPGSGATIGAQTYSPDPNQQYTDSGDPTGRYRLGIANSGQYLPHDDPLLNPDPVSIDPTKEYVWAGIYGWAGGIFHTLPQGVDNLERDFPEVYEKMMLDAKIAACIRTLKLSTLYQGLQLIPAIKDPDDPDFELSKEISDFCQRNLDRLEVPLMSTLFELLDGLVFGHTIAELVYEYPELGESEDSYRLCLKAIKLKPRRYMAFVIDRYYNVLGLTTTRQQYAGADQVMTMLGAMFPKEKFLVFAPFTRDGDPRGQSILRPAYQSWWMKMQAWPEHLRYLAQFASPMLVGITPEKSQSRQVDKNGVAITPEQAMVSAMIAARNGAAMAFPFGTEIHAISVGNNGEAFMSSSRMFDEQISIAILLQTLATGEGLHQTRASSTVHAGILTMLIRWIQQALGSTVKTGILKRLISYNYAGDAAERLCPKVQLGSVESDDFVSTATAIVQMWAGGYLDDTQIDEMDQKLGLPARPAPPVRPNQADPLQALLDPNALAGAGAVKGGFTPGSVAGGGLAHNLPQTKPKSGSETTDPNANKSTAAATTTAKAKQQVKAQPKKG